MVFAIDEDHILRCYTNPGADADEDELWPEGNLGGVTVHPLSRLAISTTTTQVIVFYQDNDGFLSSIKSSNNGFQVAKLPVDDLLLGTPLTYFTTGQNEYLFHLKKDRTIHHLVKDGTQSEWKGMFDKYPLHFMFFYNANSYRLIRSQFPDHNITTPKEFAQYVASS